MAYCNPEVHVKEVKTYVQNNLHEKITVREIADSLDLNPSYLNTCFQKQTGESVTAYIHRTKIEMACAYLQLSHHSITEVGTMLGYFDQSHFHRTFRKVMGMTPREYQENCR